MSVRAATGAVGLLTLVLLSQAAAAPSPSPSPSPSEEIAYSVDVREGARHRARVTMRVPAASLPLELLMPIWTPGAYEVRTWGRNLSALVAVDEASGRALEARRTGPSTFRVAGHTAGSTVRVSYEVYAPALTDDGSHIDEGHALLNGTATFLLVRGRERATHRVTVSAPAGWRVACALDGDAAAGGLRAPSYEALVDAPIEIGRFAESEIETAGVRVRVVIDDGAAKPGPVPKALVDDIAALVAAEARMLGQPPFTRYLVLIHLRDGTSRVGGLEHAASTSVIVPRSRLSVGASARSVSEERDGYLELVYIVAHELVHAWDARLIRPAEHVPYDFERAQPAPSLWITEGLAELYAHRAMRATGLWSEEALVDALEVQATRAALAMRRNHSLEDEAAMAWQAPDEAAFDPESWYARGHMAALALDGVLRARTSGRRSLDDAVRALFDEARRRGGALPVDQRALASAITAVDPVAGPEAARLLPSLVNEPGELSRVGAALARVGLRLEVSEGPAQASYGWQLASSSLPTSSAGAAAGGRAAHVVDVLPAGPAALAGVRAGDRVSVAGGGDVRLLAAPRPGASLLVEIVRATQRLMVSLLPSVERPVRARVIVEQAVPRQVAKWRDALLGGADRQKIRR